MSLLTGMTGAGFGAAIPSTIDFVDSGVISFYFRGMSLDATGAICCKTGPSTFFWKDGFLYDAASNMICYDLVGAIDHYISGIPCNVQGAICIENNPVAFFYQGVPYTASGKIAFV